jgi:hypothetical protein
VTGSARRQVDRPVAWDALLAIALTALGILSSFAFVGVVAVAAGRGQGHWAPTLAISACALVGLVCARSIRNWPSTRVHRAAWLALSTALAVGVAWLANMWLAPWPDLLSDEVISGGPIRFNGEAVKSFVPWLAGALAAFVFLRYDPLGTAPSRMSEAAEQGVEADKA